MYESELRLHLNCASDNPNSFTHGVQQKQIFSVFTFFKKNTKTKFKTYAYIQMFALNLMEVLEIKQKL